MEIAEQGEAEILSLILAAEPLFLAGEDLLARKNAATARGHRELAALLSSLIEQAILDELPAPQMTSPASPALRI